MKFNGKATDALRERPSCDICGEPAACDAAITFGGRTAWGYVCEADHRAHGHGLGEGVGQVLLCGDDRDQELIASYGLS